MTTSLPRIGILGGGQLAQMLAQAASPLGITCTVLDPSADPCAATVAKHIRGEYDDLQALYQLAQVSDVITYEFENVPVESARWLAARLPVHPNPKALEVSQDRLVEKRFFQSLGIPTPAFASVDTEEELRSALQDFGYPAVLKTRRFGYDGKGQFVIRDVSQVNAAWKALGGRPLILEGFVAFDKEVSLLCVGSTQIHRAYYPLVQNEHREGMLYRSIAPAPDLREEMAERAYQFGDEVLRELQYVGVLAIEWFVEGGRLIANEMAPRVHNSGHWTSEGCLTSQFENHIRAICGLPLGDTMPLGFSLMYNLIGVHVDQQTLLQIPRSHLHWYGKEPKPRRKVGHVTLLTQTEELRDSYVESMAATIAELRPA